MVTHVASHVRASATGRIFFYCLEFLLRLNIGDFQTKKHLDSRFSIVKKDITTKDVEMIH